MGKESKPTIPTTKPDMINISNVGGQIRGQVPKMVNPPQPPPKKDGGLGGFDILGTPYLIPHL